MPAETKTTVKPKNILPEKPAPINRKIIINPAKKLIASLSGMLIFVIFAPNSCLTEILPVITR